MREKEWGEGEEREKTEVEKVVRSGESFLFVCLRDKN